MKVIPILVILFVACKVSFGAVSYVTTGGGGSGDGSSWINARPATGLQTAINAAAPGDEVWVAGGTYIPTAGAGRLATFTMRNGVAVYGSFAGTETLLAERNISGGLTSILSGELGVPGIADNSYHVITNAGLNNTAIIDGFIIRDANDNRVATTTDGLGGGIYNNGSGLGNFCSPTIRNCVIINNQAVFGAGIFNSGYNGGVANPNILNCVIANNIATTGGGGIDNFGLLNGNASPVITNCVIYNNTAAFRAGAMYCWGGNLGNASPVVVNTVFVNNAAIDGGGVVSDRLNSGPGSSGNSDPNFRNCIFWQNTATGTGPQFLILGGATFTATYSDINLTGQIAPNVISGPGTGNIDADPLFLNIAVGAGVDGIWMTSDDGLQLSGMASPCYNSGDNTGISGTDLLFNNRIADGIVDMGAYELNSTPMAADIFTFTAEKIASGEVSLSWSIAGNANVAAFELQRSDDLMHFEGLYFVNDPGHHQYFFKDAQPNNGINYYRIQIKDVLGNHHYSEILSVVGGHNKIAIYPNPCADFMQVLGTSSRDIKGAIVYDSQGVIVLQSMEGNKNFDLTAIKKGIYFIQIETETGVLTGTFIRQ